MVLKIRAWENNQEKVIPIADITGTINRAREVHEIADIVGDEITLSFVPLTYSDMIYLNGMMLTEGADYDYTLTGNVVSFNAGVLTQTGHVLINYSYQ